MPINIDVITPGGITITKAHFADRLQINLLPASEDVRKMQIEVFFKVDTLLEGEKIAETPLDSLKLIFDCEEDPELEAAMLVIQNRIGVKRYLQLMAIAAQPEIENLNPIPPSL